MSPIEKKYREMSDSQIKKAANNNLNSSCSARNRSELEVMIEDVIRNRNCTDNEIKKTLDMSQGELDERREDYGE